VFDPSTAQHLIKLFSLFSNRSVQNVPLRSDLHLVTVKLTVRTACLIFILLNPDRMTCWYFFGTTLILLFFSHTDNLSSQEQQLRETLETCVWRYPGRTEEGCASPAAILSVSIKYENNAARVALIRC
jgi:hypothetical protein